MRKIPRELENPIYNFIVTLIDPLCPIFKKLHFTPNIITTLSLITGMFSAYFLYKSNVIVFSVLFLLSYIFDCMDGYYARKYDMVTRAGDIYDHIKDTLVLILVLTVFIYKNKNNIAVVIVSLIIMSLSLVLMLSFFGCQERIYNKSDSPTLSFTKRFCPDTSMIKLLKFFGSATIIFVFIFIVVFVEKSMQGR